MPAMRDITKFQKLLDFYTFTDAWEVNRTELFQMLRTGNYQDILIEHIDASFEFNKANGPALSKQEKDNILTHIFATVPTVPHRTKHRFWLTKWFFRIAGSF